MNEDDRNRTTLVNDAPAGPARFGDDEVLLISMSGNSVGQIFRPDVRRPLILIGRDDESDVHLQDAEVSRRHAALRFDAETEKFILIDLGSSNGTWVNGSRLSAKEEAPVAVGDKIRLGNTSVLRMTLSSEPEAEYAMQMYHAALRDGLTGSFNRRYLDERIRTELAFATRHEDPLALLLVDLDHFKRVNDTHGHLVGDAVLVAFTKLLDAEVRTEDVVARFGGEEFAILCRETNLEQSLVLAERVRAAVEAHAFIHDGATVTVTVSIGIANAAGRGDIDADHLVKAADEALYAAKTGGRNRCMAAD